jgi:hypothetical protein
MRVSRRRPATDISKRITVRDTSTGVEDALESEGVVRPDRLRTRTERQPPAVKRDEWGFVRLRCGVFAVGEGAVVITRVDQYLAERARR